jgi:ArsR family transcriptional regulator
MAHISTVRLSDVHAALAEPLRLRLLRLVLERELCVCEVMQVVDEPQYKISRHLGALKRAGLLRDWKEGTWVHYELRPDLPPELAAAFRALKPLWDRDPQVRRDLVRLKSACPRRPGASMKCC